MNYITTIGEKEFNVEVLDKHHISVNGKVMQVDFESISGQPVYSLLIDGKSYEAFVSAGEDEWQVLLLGRQYPVKVEDAREKRLRAAAGGRPQGGGEFQLPADSAPSPDPAAPDLKRRCRAHCGRARYFVDRCSAPLRCPGFP